MNDRYSFRGKRADNGEWVIGNLLIIDNEEYRIVTSCLQGDDENLLDNVCAYKVVSETVGQCTDLKDKNGKLIFEGDIVERYSYYDDICGFSYTAECYGVIVWNTNDYCWNIKTNNELMPFNDYDWDISMLLGNIHDNPELLEVKK